MFSQKRVMTQRLFRKLFPISGNSFRKFFCAITRIFRISNFIGKLRFRIKFPENPLSHAPKACLYDLTGLQHHFQADDSQFISQARIEAVNRRCDSYNKMLILSILIFNAIIIAFITFLFFFPFQKYEL